MKQEDKELLLKDLCTRLPYGVKIELMPITRSKCTTLTPVILCDYFISDNVNYLPYLRPMSSMTEEEKDEYSSFVLREYDGYLTDDSPDYTGKYYLYIDNVDTFIDYLNAHHFDYRELIEKGLALEAPNGIYR